MINHIDLVLPAGTNDLANRNVSPEDLIKELDESITDFTAFSNVQSNLSVSTSTEI